MEKQFSVIIPTMYKCKDILILLLEVLNQDPAVAEIILVENTTEDSRPEIIYSIGEKLVIFPQGKNTFVNPSWNFGVAQAKKEHIAILNDDIIVPDNIFQSIQTCDFSSVGVIGACDFLIQEVEKPQRFKTRYPAIYPTAERMWGYGIMMIMEKSKYFEIPKDLLIWAGDDYLFHKNKKLGRTNYLLFTPIQTRMSSTSNNKEFDDIKSIDNEVYEKKYKL